jgi:hypothetical protein
MKKRAALQEVVRGTQRLDADVPADYDDAVWTLREFGLALKEVLREGRAAVRRLEATRSTSRPK